MDPRPAAPAAPRAPRKLGVVVVDALPVVRAGLSMLIDDRPDMEVIAETGGADDAVEIVSRVRRSRVVVLVGLGLAGDHDGYWLIRTLRGRFPSHAILGCGANADATTISRTLFMGADGFVDKNIDPVEFLRSLRRAADGEMVLTGPASASVGQIADGIERRRELEILTMVSHGSTMQQVGRRLGISPRTVETHVAKLYRKLGVRTRVQAVAKAAELGLIDP